MDLYDRISDYTVLSREQCDGYRKVTLRTHSGYIVNCRIPDHTPEQEQEIRENITEALIKIAYPDLDTTKVNRMEVII